MSPGTERMALAIADVFMGFHFPTGQRRVMRDPWFAAEGLHAGLPLGSVGTCAARAMDAIYDGVCNLVGHGCREMGIPVEYKGQRVKAYLFAPVNDAPLPGRFPLQVESDLRYGVCPARDHVKLMGF